LMEQFGSETVSVSTKLPNGEILPDWLKFDSDKLRFTSLAVPDSAFPIEIVLDMDRKSFRVIVSERTENDSL